MLNDRTTESPKHCFARLKARELAEEMEIRGLTKAEIAQVAGGFGESVDGFTSSFTGLERRGDELFATDSGGDS